MMALYSLVSGLAWLTYAQGSVIRTGIDTGQQPQLSTAPDADRAGPFTIDTLVPAEEPWAQSSFKLRRADNTQSDSVKSGSSVSSEEVNVPYKSHTSFSASDTGQTRTSLSQGYETGTISTSPTPSNQATTLPVINSTSTPSTTLSQPTQPTTSAMETISSFIPGMTPKDIFAEPIDTRPPPPEIKVRQDHPVPRKGIQTKAPLQTNKFYSNFFLSDQRGPTYTFPYSIAWAGGKGAGGSWGMACSHVEANQRVFGKEKFNGASSYYTNPVGIQALVISAKELGKHTTLTMDSVTAFSTRAHLSQDDKAPPAISFPIVQGMAYITAQFSGSTPLFQSGVYFKTVTKVTKDPKENVGKFTFTLEDGSTWRLYAWKTKGDPLDLHVVNNGLAESKKPFHGVIQISKDPCTQGSEAQLDDGAGIYPLTLKLSGSASGAQGVYNFNFQKEGHGTGNMYMYALPHHVDSFDEETKKSIRQTQLQTTTKGLGTLVEGAKWTMVEPNMPTNMGLAPWDPERGSIEDLSAHARSIIRGAALKEAGQDMIMQTNLDSMYFSGKALAKLATILYVIGDLLEDKKLAQEKLGQLKAAFGMFAANRQKFPLMYESAWGGVVSSASYVTGNSGADFGNTYYNDHHFHYGYHILAAAYIGHLDPKWLEANMDYVNILVRDIANPSAKDKYFPMWRNFDWYHGHSWAHGLYASTDGKDQESSSEDMMHAYAIKMWGQVSGNKEMEARGNLQLSIISRSLQHYYLYRQDNKVQPKQFIGNKVAGILFENKVDHTTYFDPNIEAIQGIHMIPILPSTPFVRTKEFVEEEWSAYFSDGRVDEIQNAWKGIIYASYATVQPKKAWEFFTSPEFNPHWLDGGASLTWYMAYAAALGDI